MYRLDARGPVYCPAGLTGGTLVGRPLLGERRVYIGTGRARCIGWLNLLGSPGVSFPWRTAMGAEWLG